MIVRLFAFLVLCGSLVTAQNPTLEPGNKNERPPLPTITFTLDWPGGVKPQYYELKMESTGRAVYTSVDDRKDTGEPYTLEFTLSNPVRDRIFAAARELNYFNGNFDFAKHKIAFTGTKTLRYADPDRSFQTSYNWSENSDLTQLTQLLQGIASAINYGPRLDYLERFDRLGLNSELKSLQDAARRNFVAELHTIGPTLRRIADDPNVMDLARERARSLLRIAAQETGSPAPAQ